MSLLLNIIFAGLIVLFGFKVKSFFPKLSGFDKKNLENLWLFHLLFGVIFWAYIVYGPGGDSYGYWLIPQTISIEQAFLGFDFSTAGTNAMHVLNYFPINLLQLSFFTFTILYAFIGFLGVAMFYIIAIKNIPFNSKMGRFKLFPLLFFFPSLHFWSAGAGKDSLVFFTVALFVYGMQSPRNNLIKIGLALLISYFIRPHIALLLLGSFAVVSILNSTMKLYLRLFFSLILGVSAILMLPKVTELTKMDEVTVESYSSFSENRSQLLNRSHVGSGIDISNYPLPVKFFTFYFRPLFFDASSINALINSIENLLLLLLSLKVLRNKPWKTFKAAPFVIQGLVVYLTVGGFAFSQFLSNLGIIVRMRNMFLPALLIFILWSLSYQKQFKLQQFKKMSAIK